MVKNVRTTPIRPETPSVVDNEQLFVYVPYGANGPPGEYKFNQNQFSVDTSGTVKVRVSNNIALGDSKPISSHAVYKALDEIAKALSNI